MIKKYRLLILLFTSFLSLFYSPQIIQADQNFETTFESTYTVDTTGKTHVEHHITITNRTPALYTDKYALKINSEKINNVQVTSNDQTIIPNLVNQDEITSIGLTFDDVVLGLDKKREINITYTDPNVAQLNNNVLLVTIPEFGGFDEHNHYSTTIITPLEFGLPSIINPDTATTTQNSGQIFTYFENVAGQGISVLFGDTQFYNLKLTYNLENNTNQPGITQIALPPDTTYQKVIYQDLSPQPDYIQRDINGNWMATYTLDPQIQTLVTADIDVKLSINPIQNHEATNLGNNPQIIQVTGNSISITNTYDPFDLKHIILATQNLSETNPKPMQESTTISFIKDIPLPQQQLDISIQKNKLGFLYIPGRYQIVVENKTGQAYYNQEVSLTTEKSIHTNLSQNLIPYIVPFETKKIALNAYADGLFTFTNTNAAIRINNQVIHENITTGNTINQLFIIPPIFIVLGISLIVLTLITGSLLVFRRKK